MFGFFKKEKSVIRELTDLQSAFIGSISKALAQKYPQFLDQFELGTFAYLGRNPIGGHDSYVFGINNDKWIALCDTTVNNFDIRNIIFKTFDGERVVVNLYISEGLVIGYQCDVPIEKIDLHSINVSSIYEHHFLNNDLSLIKPFLNDIENDKLKQLNLLSNAYMVRMGDSLYVVIHDNGNGDFFGLNINGNVYHLTYDPFNTYKLNDSLKDFLESNYT